MFGYAKLELHNRNRLRMQVLPYSYQYALQKFGECYDWKKWAN
jgi:hypothetical protein